jgi:hypothetical protein
MAFDCPRASDAGNETDNAESSGQSWSDEYECQTLGESHLKTRIANGKCKAMFAFKIRVD